MIVTASGPGQGMLTLQIEDKNDLYTAYMPFVKGGGLFIPTKKHYKLGDQVFIVLSFMDDPEKLPIAGKVIWTSPKAAQGGHPPGVGVQLGGKDSDKARDKIETYLAGAQKSDKPTNTM
jgi:type IV pilus assembly protein PilZ